MAAFWLRSKGFPVSILCQGPKGGFTHTSPLSELPVRQLGVTTAAFLVSLSQSLVAARMNPKAIFYVHGHPCTPAALLALAGISRNRVIYHTQDYLEPGCHPKWEFFERRFAKRAGHVISNEVNRGRFLASHYGLQKNPWIVPTFLPRIWPAPQFDQNARRELLERFGSYPTQKARLLMHQGGFAAVRCGKAIVEALSKLPREYLLVFTGMGSESREMEQLRTCAGKAGVLGRVLGLSRLSYEEMQRYGAASDLGLLLYPNDGIGNFYQSPGRLTQYLACGLPILASNFPSLELLCLKYGLGAVCDCESPQAIADAILRVLSKSSEDQIKERARLRGLATDILSYDQGGETLERILSNAMAKLTG